MFSSVEFIAFSMCEYLRIEFFCDYITYYLLKFCCKIELSQFLMSNSRLLLLFLLISMAQNLTIPLKIRQSSLMLLYHLGWVTIE